MQKMQERAVDVMAVSFPLYHKMNHPEVTALDDQRTPSGGQGELFHRGYVVVQNLQRRQGEKKMQKDERQRDKYSSGWFVTL